MKVIYIDIETVCQVVNYIRIEKVTCPYLNNSTIINE